MNAEEREVDRIDEYAVSLRALLEQEEAEAGDLRLKLARAEERARRVRKAIDALQPKPRKAKAPSKAKASAIKPSEKSLDAVRTALEQADGPLSTVALVKATGLSRPTITATLRYLRDVETVRLAGTADGSPVYALDMVIAGA